MEPGAGPQDAPEAYVAMGANLGDPLAQLRAAARMLETIGDVVARSSIYATVPVGGPQGQAEYLNAVVTLTPRTRDPEAVLDALLAIERRLGRQRSERWGPRLIDLDLLAFGDAVVGWGEAGVDARGVGPTDAQVGLTLPHPRMAERAFVLVPLCEVTTTASARQSAWKHPVTGLGPCEMLEALGPTAGVRLTDLRW